MALACCFISIWHLVSAELGQVRWTYSSGLTNYTDLALGPDGTIYLGWAKTYTVKTPLPAGGYIQSAVVTNHLFALTPSGQDKWSIPNTGHSLALLSDGRILAVSRSPAMIYHSLAGDIIPFESPFGESKLWGINTDGTVWFPGFSAGKVAVTADDNAIVLNLKPSGGTNNPNAVAKVALQPGSTGWTNTHELAGHFPVIAPDGRVIHASWSSFIPNVLPSDVEWEPPFFRNILKVAGADGNLKQTFLETNFNYSTPAVGSDGTLYLATAELHGGGSFYSFSHNFRAISPSGKIAWTVSNFWQFSPAVVDNANNVYVTSGGVVLSYDSRGAQRWFYVYGPDIDLCPALAADGTLYVATRSGHLLALDSTDGNLKWSYDSGRPIHFPPTIGADGTIYLLVDNSDLIAIEGSAPPADAPWPQDRHDAQRTSRATQASAGGLTRGEDGKFSLMLNLEPGRDYKVEASEDLETWTEIGSFTSSSAARTFLDETSAGKSKRFYRLVMPGSSP